MVRIMGNINPLMPLIFSLGGLDKKKIIEITEFGRTLTPGLDLSDGEAFANGLNAIIRTESDVLQNNGGMVESGRRLP